MATPQTSAQKLTELRIQRALAKPRAIGMRGFLLWTEAAWPPAISKKILEAANKYTPGASIGPASGAATLASPAAQGFGFLGDDSGITTDLYFTPTATDMSDPTQAPVSGTTAATPAQPASSSWVSDITNAIGAATTAYLGTQQVKDAQTIFNTNLARAQQGLPMIPTNPTRYGLPAATANIGLTSQTESLVLWLGGGLAAVLLLSAFLKKKG